MDLKVITRSRGDELVGAADPTNNQEGTALNTLKTLIEYQDFPVDSQDTLRFATCLMKAAGRQFSNVVKYLLGRDADMFVTDNVGWNALFWTLATTPGDNTVTLQLWNHAVEMDASGKSAVLSKSAGGHGGGAAAAAATTEPEPEASSDAAASAAAADKPTDEKKDKAAAAAAAAASSASAGGGEGGAAKREKQRPDHWRRKLMMSATATGYTVLMFAVKYYRKTLAVAASGKKKGKKPAAGGGNTTQTDGTIAQLPTDATGGDTKETGDGDAEDGDMDGTEESDTKDGAAAAATGDKGMNPLEFVIHKLYELKEQHTITSTRSAYNESVKDLSVTSGAWHALEKTVRTCEEKYNRDKKMPPVDLFESGEAEKSKALAQSAAAEAASGQPFYYDDGLRQIHVPSNPDRRCGGFGFDFSLFGYQFHFGAYPNKSIKINKTLSTALKNAHLKEDK